MTRFLQRAITNEELRKLGGRYEGQIERVEAQQVFNRFKYTREEVVPVIHFENGWLWIPNISARRRLTDAWGPDTDGWIGRRMAIYFRTATRVEARSGRGVEVTVKVAEPLSDEWDDDC